MTRHVSRNEFSVTIGLCRGSNHIFVTHRNSGKQWQSKSPVEPKAQTDLIETNIQLGITRFDPNAVMGSCDHRFWMVVKQPSEIS